ncbi:MAG: UvrD-helicase domain-containing protein [Elusimicrobia bacterium]|nr:UvrD-helicase domain-containing protein [Elusimicrobiota bacterium]
MTDHLNPQQKKAVEITEGPLLIFAGAGSGKTTVIIHRIVRLLNQGVSPFNILAVTFTNKAAQEMRNRVKQLAGPEGESVWISTFHAFASRVLRYDYEKSFTIYDEKDQLVAIKQALKKMGHDPKKVKPAMVRELIQNAKNSLIDPESFCLNAAAHSDKLRMSMGEVYQEYQRILENNGGLDFGDLIVETVNLFKNRPEVLEKYRERFEYIMVDEYQATNYAQYVLIKLLAPPHNNICVVGDDDQSIYSWRGANVRNILDFEKTFKCKNTLKLEQNYRSTQSILTAAHNVIQNNLSRKSKKLWTDNPSGEKVKWNEFMTSREEARGVVKEIQRLIGMGYRPGDIAIFYRVNAQSRPFEDLLRYSGYNYKIVGGLRFYERKEIKDILAYMRVLMNPGDDISFERIINTPARGIGAKSLLTIKEAAATEKKSLFDMVISGSDHFSNAIEKKIQPLRELLLRLNETYETDDAAALAKDVIELSGYHRMLELDEDLTARSRLENIEELVSAFSEEENKLSSIDDILSEISLLTELDNMEENQEYITLMTVHLAKGLEFPVVFLTGLEEELFPYYDALSDPAQMEEERRLCYVGMTRAEKLLYLTNASQRMMYGQSKWHLPSRFIRESLGNKGQDTVAGDLEYVYD